MARLTARIPIEPNWVERDKLLLKVGSENAANLAASTPAGGTTVAQASARPGEEYTEFRSDHETILPKDLAIGGGL